MSEQFLLPFIKKEKIAKNTWSFYFDRQKIPQYSFKPGQYTRVTLPFHPIDGNGNYRLFTTCSSPLQKEYLMITTRIQDDSSKVSDFKKHFASLSIGEEVQFFGPMGGFYLQEDNLTPRIFIAGGIGITPFYSMLMYASKKQLKIPLLLFSSFSTVEEICFRQELQDAALKNEHIKIIYTVSHPRESKTTWTGEVGRVSKALIEKYALNIQKSIFMVVGSMPMVEETVDLLNNMHVAEEKIKVEQFLGY